MNEKSIYITVRLDIEYQDSLNWEDVKQEILSEMDYSFNYWKVEDEEVKFGIASSEICGENEI